VATDFVHTPGPAIARLSKAEASMMNRGDTEAPRIATRNDAVK
jgi:hypothetical protein